jgi:hypothetical protein
MSEDQLRADVAALAPNLMREATGLALRTKLEILAAVLVVVGVVLWDLSRQPAPLLENVTAVPQVTQADGSVLAARAPDAHPPKPRHMLPKGSIEERREQIVVAPAPGASSVEIDLSLVRNGDQRRVVASSPDGQVLSAVDIPIEPALIPPPPKPWAAGLSYGTNRSMGVWVERDIGRLRVGAEVAKGNDRPRAELRVGMIW